MIFIIKGFRTTVFIFIVISTTFSIDMSSSLFQVFVETYTELRTTSFIESTGVACSDSVSHNHVQVLSIPVLLPLAVRLQVQTLLLASNNSGILNTCTRLWLTWEPTRNFVQRPLLNPQESPVLIQSAITVYKC